MSPGNRFWQAIADEKPLQIVGTINAYCAKLAEAAGFKCIYLSGSGVAAASYGLPDLGVTSLHDVLTDASRITNSTELPLLVDIDTGWGSAFNIARTVKELEKAGVAAVHLEDQVSQKRCGHLPNKKVVSIDEMSDRLKAATDARIDSKFSIVARTDAFQQFGLEEVLERITRFIEVGADVIFPEAISDYDTFCKITEHSSVPVLANLTEFGKTPLFSIDELVSMGIALALYPLSAFRSMSKAALETYSAIRRDQQIEAISTMQTREELYGILKYHEWEAAINSTEN